ncbi:hypothetical protein [Goodfellowiella coeruleoviolacea]|uniref:hypothetical protein n=1 Tax=Goodfellowiella coeruleoviolacea TaxID=334858 RepID=UPI0020A3D493|nr:hypothetical protein [Goodfellowiella coeruleoviolacea]
MVTASLVALNGVGTASGLTAAPADQTTGQVLPVHAGLADLLPWGGLRRGSTVSVRGSTSLLFALLARATTEGSWGAVVGLPDLGLLAASEIGVVTRRLALVPHPGRELTSVVAALLDGIDLVVVAVPEADRLGVSGRDARSGRTGTPQVSPSLARRLSARARQRRAVLLPFGPWPGADVEIACIGGRWSGLGEGHGRLRHREVVAQARGRGAAVRPVRVNLMLPSDAGAVGIAPERTGRSAGLASEPGGPGRARGSAPGWPTRQDWSGGQDWSGVQPVEAG